MPHYIALIHKDADSCYGVSFPDIPGVITGGDTIDEAMQQAVEVLHFAAEDWTNPDGSAGFKSPSTIDELRETPNFLKTQRTPWSHSWNFPPAPTRRSESGDDSVNGARRCEGLLRLDLHKKLSSPGLTLSDSHISKTDSGSIT